jgi:hypothetical protein
MSSYEWPSLLTLAFTCSEQVEGSYFEALKRLPEPWGMVIAIASCLPGLAVYIWILLFLQSCYRAVPAEHRRMQPELVWLMLVPLFFIVWQYFVFLRLSRSFSAAYAAQGRLDVDSSEKLALAYCICFTLWLVPFVNCVAAPAALVLLILVLLRFKTLKRGLLEQAPA